MGIQSFFKWLTSKYPSLTCDCVINETEQDEKEPDQAKPNPNGEFDNLYLDMNGIVHECLSPQGGVIPVNEDVLISTILKYINQILIIARPRKLIYMALDGVAPSAKTAKKRANRFKDMKERKELACKKEQLRTNGATVPSDQENHFDNCINPGTPFMQRLTSALRFYSHFELNNNPEWKNISVIFSDSSVPGEGEHKIAEFIRCQRSSINRDTTKHVLFGNDADLILLGLATHEANISIIRKKFKRKINLCQICGEPGHEFWNCPGSDLKKSELREKNGLAGARKIKFEVLHLFVLRERLKNELKMPNSPFVDDFERALDDWIFLCLFLGNDFLPRLPSLEIWEMAMERLVALCKNCVIKTEGWVTNNGDVDLHRLQMILTELGEVEGKIFKYRHHIQEKNESSRQDNTKRFRAEKESCPPQGQSSTSCSSGFSNPNVKNVLNIVKASQPSNLALSTSSIWSNKRKRSCEEEDDSNLQDDVRLWENGYKERYYRNKFSVSPTDVGFRSKVAREYVRGLCWILQYYYKGVPSWEWYFPYHYAPFASDFFDISSVDILFEKGTKPLRPLEHIMSIFPATSRSHVPLSWGELMVDPESPIIDFYPDDFRIDFSENKSFWQGVALLPFVDEQRLKKAIEPLFDKLTEDEKRRNEIGENLLLVSKNHKGYDFLRGLVREVGSSAGDGFEVFKMESSLFGGISGFAIASEKCVGAGKTLETPFQGLGPVYDVHVVRVNYRNPLPDEENSSSSFDVRQCVYRSSVFDRLGKRQSLEAMVKGDKGSPTAVANRIEESHPPSIADRIGDHRPSSAAVSSRYHSTSSLVDREEIHRPPSDPNTNRDRQPSSVVARIDYHRSTSVDDRLHTFDRNRNPRSSSIFERIGERGRVTVAERIEASRPSSITNRIGDHRPSSAAATNSTSSVFERIGERGRVTVAERIEEGRPSSISNRIGDHRPSSAAATNSTSSVFERIGERGRVTVAERIEASRPSSIANRIGDHRPSSAAATNSTSSVFERIGERGRVTVAERIEKGRPSSISNRIGDHRPSSAAATNRYPSTSSVFERIRDHPPISDVDREEIHRPPSDPDTNRDRRHSSVVARIDDHRSTSVDDRLHTFDRNRNPRSSSILERIGERGRVTVAERIEESRPPSVADRIEERRQSALRNREPHPF